MENMDVLARGVLMPGSGLGLGSSISFRGVEMLWVVVVATVVLAWLSVKNLSYVSVGWTWGSKPGQVRVRVQSFSSMSDVGVFTADILNCSADSCSEDASSSSDEQSDGAEMVFIFEKNSSPRFMSLHQEASTLRIDAERTSNTHQIALQEFLRIADAPLTFNPYSFDIETSNSSRREGIEWDVSPASVDSFLPLWAQSLANPLVYRAPLSPLCVPSNVSSPDEWDPLLKLRIRDAVVSDNSRDFSRDEFRFPLAPIVTRGSGLVTLKDNVVRVWDSENKSLLKSVRLLPRGYGGDVMSTAFDADFKANVAAIGRKGGLVSMANLESAEFENSYTTHQSLQAIHLDKCYPLSKTMFTGGPAIANPGCSVSLWDSRSSSRQLSVNLSAAKDIYGIRSQGRELYVRDVASSIAVHDVRMLGASSVSRLACDVEYESASQDKWWDIDATSEREQEDVEDEFWECQSEDETKGAMGGYVGSFVMAMGRNFTTMCHSS